jgi:hypothetical protein
VKPTDDEKHGFIQSRFTYRSTKIGAEAFPEGGKFVLADEQRRDISFGDSSEDEIEKRGTRKWGTGLGHDCAATLSQSQRFPTRIRSG